MKLAVLVMCGGQGKRLWPLSSAAQPKQFLAYPQQHSLFVQTLQRNYLEGFSQIDYIIVTSKEYQEQVRAELDVFLAWLAAEQAKANPAAPVASVSTRVLAAVPEPVPGLVSTALSASVDPAAPAVKFYLVLEEVGRNTFPALQAGLFTYLNTTKQPADYLLVTPSDHYIAGDYAADLQQALAKCSASQESREEKGSSREEKSSAWSALAEATQATTPSNAELASSEPGSIHPCICSLGVTPSEPSTELGYIWNRNGEVVFLEKPDLAQAQALLAQNQAAGGQLVLWNTGIWVGSLSKVAKLVAGFGRREVFAGLVGAVVSTGDSAGATSAGDSAASPWLYCVVFPAEKATKLPVESLDKALMEKIRLSCHPAGFKWSDLGSWTAVTRLAQEVPAEANSQPQDPEQQPNQAKPNAQTHARLVQVQADAIASSPGDTLESSLVPVNQQHIKHQEHNLFAGRVHAHQVTNSFIRSYQKPIIAIGVDNLAIIENEDYIVVTALDRIDEARVLAEQAAASEQDREAARKQSPTAKDGSK